MQSTLENVLFFVGKGDFIAAKKQMESLLENDATVKSNHLYSLAKCISFWSYRTQKDFFDKKKLFLYLLSQWKLFQDFCREDAIFLEENLSLFVRGVFISCQDFFLDKRKEISSEHWEDIVQILIISKDFSSAKKVLQGDLLNDSKNIKILQQLSFVCYKLDSNSLAKLYLSYAFLFDPLQIDITKITIPEVVSVKLNLMQNGFRERELLLWIPVYASIRGIFPPKKLSILEKKFILQSIKKMETVCTQDNVATVQPMLLYHYLFALHHFYLVEDEVCVNKILRRINYNSEKIYQEVFNNILKKKTTSNLSNVG